MPPRNAQILQEVKSIMLDTRLVQYLLAKSFPEFLLFLICHDLHSILLHRHIQTCLVRRQRQPILLPIPQYSMHDLHLTKQIQHPIDIIQWFLTGNDYSRRIE